MLKKRVLRRFGIHLVKRPLGRPRNKWQITIMDLTKEGCED
jgi:hypothetical protein